MQMCHTHTWKFWNHWATTPNQVFHTQCSHLRLSQSDTEPIVLFQVHIFSSMHLPNSAPVLRKQAALCQQKAPHVEFDVENPHLRVPGHDLEVELSILGQLCRWTWLRLISPCSLLWPWCYRRDKPWFLLWCLWRHWGVEPWQRRSLDWNYAPAWLWHWLRKLNEM